MWARSTCIRCSTSSCAGGRRHHDRNLRSSPSRGGDAERRARIDRRQDGRGFGARPKATTRRSGRPRLTTFRSLYLHIPFWRAEVAEYCDFHERRRCDRVPARTWTPCARRRATWVSASARLTLDTVFIGGGTPSLVAPELLADLVATVRSTFSVAGGRRDDHGGQPRRASRPARAGCGTLAGVNRISIGVQSLEADALRFLRPGYDADRALAAIAGGARGGLHLRSTGGPHLRGPGLGDTGWRRTLERVVAAGPRTSRATS